MMLINQHFDMPHSSGEVLTNMDFNKFVFKIWGKLDLKMLSVHTKIQHKSVVFIFLLSPKVKTQAKLRVPSVLVASQQCLLIFLADDW